MGIGKLATAGVLAGAFALLTAGAEAQTATQGTRVAQALTPDDLAARPVLAARPARPPRRIRIYPRQQAEPGPDVYPRYNPGPNAVRVCNASYVQEYRPSGTVIVPHMTCVWSHGQWCKSPAAPAQQAQALSLANPASVTAVQEGSRTSTTEVRWHHHWHHHH